jgi:hypothetical protein
VITRYRADVLDGLAIAVSAALVVPTIWAASSPVPSLGDYPAMMILWPIAAALWAASIINRSHEPRVRGFGFVIIAGSIVAVGTLGVPLAVIAFDSGSIGLGLCLVLGIAVTAKVLLPARGRRLRWLIPPLLVIATFTIVASGVPRAIRFATSETALTAYAEQVRTGTQTAMPGDIGTSIQVGSIPIFRVETIDGVIHLTTAYVGILDDDPAGLAYVPTGTPSGPGVYQHVDGPWFLWLPY